MAALAVISCQKVETKDAAGKVFSAIIEEAYVSNADDVETKTSLDAGGNVLWKKGDQVSIFFGSTVNEKFRVTDVSEGKTAASLYQVATPSFVAGSVINNNVAFYPYGANTEISKNGSTYVISAVTLPEIQSYVQASFGSGAFPMMAVTSSTSDMILKFKNVIGGLKLQINGTAAVKTISIKGNNNDILWGDATVTGSNTTNPAITMNDASATTVILDCGDGVQLDTQTTTSFIIALPPITMSKGFTVTVTNTDGSTMEIKTTKSQTITRSNLLSMPAVRFDANEEIRVPVEKVELSEKRLNLVQGETATLVATVTPSNATHPAVIWSSSNSAVASVEYSGEVTAVSPGTATITAKTYDGGFKATCKVTVYAPTSPDVFAAVDLGLPSGLKWANCNLGANAPEEYGDYYAWGETTPKVRYTDASYLYRDNETAVLIPECDAAHVNLGGDWRMPTDEEWTELREHCIWTWTTYNGVYGRLVSGPSGNSIFLPAAGNRDDMNLNGAGDQGFYWSSTMVDSSDAWFVYFDSGNVNMLYGNNNYITYTKNYRRYRGSSVRPVTE